MDKALPDAEMRKKVKPHPHAGSKPHPYAGDRPHLHAVYPHTSGYRESYRSIRL